MKIFNVKTCVCSIFIADTNDNGCSCCSSCSFKWYLDRNNTFSHKDNDVTIIDKDGCRLKVQIASSKKPPSKPAEVLVQMLSLFSASVYVIDIQHSFIQNIL